MYDSTRAWLRTAAVSNVGKASWAASNLVVEERNDVNVIKSPLFVHGPPGSEYERV